MIKVGDEFETNNYGRVTVIKYISCKKVKVKFENGEEKTTSAQSLRRGAVMPDSHKCLLGEPGLSCAKVSSGLNKHNKAAKTQWNNSHIIARCISHK